MEQPDIKLIALENIKENIESKWPLEYYDKEKIEEGKLTLREFYLDKIDSTIKYHKKEADNTAKLLKYYENLKVVAEELYPPKDKKHESI